MASMNVVSLKVITFKSTISTFLHLELLFPKDIINKRFFLNFGKFNWFLSLSDIQLRWLPLSTNKRLPFRYGQFKFEIKIDAFCKIVYLYCLKNKLWSPRYHFGFLFLLNCLLFQKYMYLRGVYYCTCDTYRMVYAFLLNSPK